MDELIEPNQKTIHPVAKTFLVLWIVVIVVVYIAVYWPPTLWPLADIFGVSGFIQMVRDLVTPFFTADYLAGFGG